MLYNVYIYILEGTVLKKILAIILSITLITMLFASTYLISANAEDKVAITFYDWNSGYPAGLTPTKPYKGTVSKVPPKTYGNESQPFTGTIETQEDVTEENWYDDMFKGSEGDVAAQKADRDAANADNTRPSKMIEPALIIVIAVAVALVVGAVVFIVLTVANKKKKATPVKAVEVETAAEEVVK